MKCSICKQEGHNKRTCKKATTTISSEITSSGEGVASPEVSSIPSVPAHSGAGADEPIHDSEPSSIEIIKQCDAMATSSVKVEINFESEIRDKLESHKRNSKQKHFDGLRSEFPTLKDLTDSELEKIYMFNNSHSQSERCKNGGKFEKIIEEYLKRMCVPYCRQVPIDKDGFIVNKRRNNKIIDIVIGNPVVGQHISNYIIISLKTSTRERASEDEWTKVHVPKLYLYGTVSSDYPDPDKFEESDTRKILCLNPKINDTRKFKLGFNHLYDLVRYDLVHE